MRITSTTSVPVSANEITAAGPAEPMTTPLPTKSPAPITPPSAIICMWRRRSERRRPDDPGASCRIGCALVMATRSASYELLVLLEVAHRLGEGIAPERIAEFLRHHQLEHRGLAVALRARRLLERRRDICHPPDRDALAAEGPRHPRPAGIFQVDALITTRIEIDVILLFRAPLCVVEHHHRDADALACAGEQLVEADAPRAIAHVGERRALRGGDLRAADDRKGVTAVSEAHGGEHRTRLLEAQIRVGDRADI